MNKCILIIQSLGLGDLVFSLPVFRLLKQAYPESSIHVLTNEANADFLKVVPEIEQIFTYRKTWGDLLNCVKQVRSLKCEKVFVLNPILKGAVLAYLSGAKIRVGYRRDFERKQSLYGFQSFLLSHHYLPREEKLHEADRYLELLSLWGLKVPEDARVPRLSQEKTSPGKRTAQPMVVMHPGAAWKNRRWPGERFALLADWIVRSYGAKIAFTGSPQETALIEGILGLMKEPAVSFANKFKLSELPAFLKQSALFLTNDTGIMHIAAAMDVPTIALFGPGDPVKVKPLSANARVLIHPMPCSPCKVQYTSRCEKNLCMLDLTVEEVKKEILKVLGEPSTEIPLSCGQEKKRQGRKRILFLQATSEISGTDITLLRTLEGLDRERYEAHVLIPQEGPFVASYRAFGSQVHLFPEMLKMTSRKGTRYIVRYLFGYLPTVLKLARIIRENHIDLVHNNTIHNLYGFLAAKIAGKPHVWHIREIVVQSKWVRALEVFLVKRFSERFIVMSNAISEVFLRKGGGFPGNISKLYDGIDLSQFHPGISGARIRKELGLGEKTFLVGAVCRLDPWKGLELFIEAAGLVLRALPQTHFLICGGEIEGRLGYEAFLKKKVTELRLESRFHFTGWRFSGPDIPEVYGALDVSVQCPIYPEPYGLANVEAMACGVPVVAAAEGGPLELCGDGESAILVPPHSPEKTAEAILTLLKDPEKAEKMGRAGRKRAEALFDRKQCVRDLESIYEEIFNKQH